MKYTNGIPQVSATFALNQGIHWLCITTASDLTLDSSNICKFVLVTPISGDDTFKDFVEDVNMAVRYGSKDLDASKLKYSVQLNLNELSSLIGFTECEKIDWDRALFISNDIIEYQTEVFRTYLENIALADDYGLAPRGVRAASRTIFTKLANFLTCTACPCFRRCFLPFTYDYLRMVTELLLAICEIKASKDKENQDSLCKLYDTFYGFLLKEVGGKYKYLVNVMLQLIKDQAILTSDKKIAAWKTTVGELGDDPKKDTMEAVLKRNGKHIRKYIEQNIPIKVYTEDRYLFNLYKKLSDPIYKYGDPQCTARVIVFLSLLKEVIKQDEFLDEAPVEYKHTLEETANKIATDETISTYITAGARFLFDTFERYATDSSPLGSGEKQLFDGAWLCTEPVGEFRERIDHSLITTLEIASGIISILAYTELGRENNFRRESVDIVRNILQYLVNVRLDLRDESEASSLNVLEKCITFAQWKDIHLSGIEISDIRGLLGVTSFMLNVMSCQKSINMGILETEPLNTMTILGNLVTVLARSLVAINSNTGYWGIVSPYLLGLQKQRQTWWSDRLGIQKNYFDKLGGIFPSVDNTLEALGVLSKYLIWQIKG